IPTGEEVTGRWTKEEHELFLQALKKYGKEWKKVASMVRTRTVVQTRTHAQKYFQKVQKSGLGPEDFEAGLDYNSFHAAMSNFSSKSSGGGGGSSKKAKRRADPPPSVAFAEPSVPGMGSAGRMDPMMAMRGDEFDYLDDSVGTYGLVALHNATGDLSPLTQGPRGGAAPLGGALATPYGYIAPSTGLSLMGTPGQAMSAARAPYASSGGRPSGPLQNSAVRFSASNKNRTPLPSPAACGKRKVDELSAARMMAGAPEEGPSEGSMEKPTPQNPKLRLSFDVNAARASSEQAVQLSVPGLGSAAKRQRHEKIPTAPVGLGLDGGTGLSIVNPEELRPLSPYIRAESSSPPLTPWEGELRELEEKNKQENFFKVTLSTPKQLKNFSLELRQCITSCDDKALIDLISPRQTMSMAATLNNSFGPLGETPLHMACSLNPASSASVSPEAVLSICKVLLEYGASTEGTDRRGQTSLHRAAAVGLRDVGKLLINKGSAINAVDENGDTALHISASYSNFSFIELLADFGCNCHVRNLQSRCAIDIAATKAECSDAGMTELRNRTRQLMMLSEPRHRTLVLYHDDCLQHIARTADDWEGPDRLGGIVVGVKDANKFQPFELEISDQFEKADVELLQRVHSPEYIAFVNSLSKQLQTSGENEAKKPAVAFTPQVQKTMLGQGETKPSEYCDTSFSSGTLRAARRAAGAVAHAVDCVLLGRNRNAFCVVRPPGHHAGYRGLLDGAKSCGFCIFNNVAAGALHALEGQFCERVAIIDIDVHHGNGTEDIVRHYNRPDRLFFFSSHLYDKEGSFEFFPGSGAGDDTACNIINVPIQPMWTTKAGATPGTTTRSRSTVTTFFKFPTDPNGAPSVTATTPAPIAGREAFRQAISLRLLPALRAFNPSLILLSTGFDAAAGDVGNCRGAEEGMDLTLEDFEWVTTEVLRVADICCNGRVISVLEGGYGARKSAGNGRSSANKEHVADVEGLDRHILGDAAVSHVHRLVDPYG
ncbi:unnamed protein product, partial [Ectocarpus fasciculatus]